VGGSAFLVIVLFGASKLGVAAGHVIANQTQLEAGGLRSIVDVVFAGSVSDFGWTPVAVGLRGRRRFRLSTVTVEASGHSGIALDVPTVSQLPGLR
jgi:hypothetical protein